MKDDSLDAEVDDQFNKVFTFQSPPEEASHRLRDPQHWFPDSRFDPEPEPDPVLSRLRDALNATKSRLNRLDLAEWHRNTNAANPAGSVLRRVRDRANPQLLTQAWCKFTEILHKFSLLPTSEDLPWRTAHLCEAPGAFVAALNHALTAGGLKSNWSWVANTLNPYYEGNPSTRMVCDDRLIFHTLDRWRFGPHGTGDILEESNRIALSDELNADGKFDLVTADGSVDCQGDPARQESIVAPLHAAEVALALNILKPEGNLVVKVFTLFEPETVALIFVLRSCFNEMNAFKPATSKEGNSEVYLVCKGYRCQEISDPVRQLLLEKATEKCLFRFDLIPESFREDVVKCATYFKDLQTKVIEKNLTLYKKKGQYKRVRHLRKLVADRYQHLYNIKPIDPGDKLAPGCKDPPLQLDGKEDYGTFEDKNRILNVADQVERLKDELITHHATVRPNNGVIFSSVKAMPEMQPKWGKPVEAVLSSKFCPSGLINIYAAAERLASSNLQANPKKKRKINDEESSSRAKVFSIYPHFEESLVQHKLDRTKSPLSTDNFKESVVEICECLKSLEPGGNFSLSQFPCLTRLQVGLVYLLASNFEEVGFVTPRGDENVLLFLQFKGDKEKLSEQLSTVINWMSEYPEKHLLELIPLSHLVSVPFYHHIVTQNRSSLREQALHQLNSIE